MKYTQTQCPHVSYICVYDIYSVLCIFKGVGRIGDYLELFYLQVTKSNLHG